MATSLARIMNLKDADENLVAEPLSEDDSQIIQKQENIALEVSPTDPIEPSVKRRKKGIQPCDPFDQPAYTIEELPPEVLGLILYKMLSPDRKRCRLVNRLWYNVLRGYHENLKPINLFILEHRNSDVPKFLMGIGLTHLHLTFKGSNLESLPENFWESVGRKFYSLELKDCHLGSQVIENIIEYCEELQYLNISLYGGVHGAFFRPQSLEKMDVRKKLKTLKFNVNLDSSRFTSLLHKCGNVTQKMDQEDGERVMAALFRIFPNIENYGFSFSGCFYSHITFECSFTRAFPRDIAEGLQLSVLFSLLLYHTSIDWTVMLNALSVVRLLSISLSFSYDGMKEEKVATLIDFFTNQKLLKTVTILPSSKPCNMRHDDQTFSFWRIGVRTSNWRELKIYQLLKPILLKILESCCELRELIYCPSKGSDCIGNLLESEWSMLCSKLSKLRKVKISNFMIDTSSIRSFSNHVDRGYTGVLAITFGKSFQFLTENFTHLEHLILKDQVSDSMLQTIFKYLTGLKTLDLCLGRYVTESGITGLTFENEEPWNNHGFPEVELPNNYGYSIDRLENLERLALYSPCYLRGRPLDDVIFFQFRFQKLKFFRCFLPREPSTLIHLGQNIPTVRDVKFSSVEEEETDLVIDKILDFCRNAENLETLHVKAFLKDEMFHRKVKQIFEACPTLKTLHRYPLIYYYRRDIREVYSLTTPKIVKVAGLEVID